MAHLQSGVLAASVVLVAVGLAGCASNVKGSWACAVQPGVVCGSITDIDNGGPPKAGRKKPAPDAVIDGAIPAKLWGEGGWSAGAIAGAPVRETDPIVKVSIAPWIDEAGDYHGASDVYSVMRRGTWYVAPRTVTRRVDLTKLSLRDPLPPLPAADPSVASPPAAAPTAKPQALSNQLQPGTVAHAAAPATR